MEKILIYKDGRASTASTKIINREDYMCISEQQEAINYQYD